MDEIKSWFIELGVLIVSLLGFGVTLHRMNLSTQNKINENTLKILAIEKEILEMKEKHEKDMDKNKHDISEIKNELSQLVTELRKDNKTDHDKLFDELKEVTIALTKVATSFDEHRKIHKRSA